MEDESAKDTPLDALFDGLGFTIPSFCNSEASSSISDLSSLTSILEDPYPVELIQSSGTLKRRVNSCPNLALPTRSEKRHPRSESFSNSQNHLASLPAPPGRGSRMVRTGRSVPTGLHLMGRDRVAQSGMVIVEEDGTVDGNDDDDEKEEQRRQRRLARNRASARMRRLKKMNAKESYEQAVQKTEVAISQLKAHRWGKGELGALLQGLARINTHLPSSNGKAAPAKQGRVLGDPQELLQEALASVEELLAESDDGLRPFPGCFQGVAGCKQVHDWDLKRGQLQVQVLKKVMAGLRKVKLPGPEKSFQEFEWASGTLSDQQLGALQVMMDSGGSVLVPNVLGSADA
ncbi:unnamed protein product [Chrysoparadoxa australica]